MYESFFALSQRPFVAGPMAARYFPAAVIEQARQALMRCVQCSQGTGLLLGPTGTGKTLLCHVLAQQFRATHRVVLLAGAKLCTRRALLQNILFELGLTYRRMSEGELRLALTSHLDPAADSTAGLLLIVDEADTLPLRLFEELRMLTNIIRDGVPRVQLILSGAPTLEERFTSPKFESFNQRISARCHLQPLACEETCRFLAWQIETAGGHSTFVFDDSALLAVQEATGGIPRLINQLCDYALHTAAVAGHRPLTAENIARAWSELQQLPSPWSTHAVPAVAEPVAEPASIIEFRALEELPSLAESRLTLFDFSASPSLIDSPEPVPSVAATGESIQAERAVAAAMPAEVAVAASEPESAGDESPTIAMPTLPGSFVIDELPATEFPAQAMSEATVAGEFPSEWAGGESLVCLASGDESPWPVIPLAEEEQLPAAAVAGAETAAVADESASRDPVAEEPELRIVRDETSAAVMPEVPPPEERRRRFRQLFSRLRRRASA